MAGRTVGQIELHASVDGPNPAEARAHGEAAGKAMGDGFDGGFSDRIEKAFAKFSNDLRGIFDDLGNSVDGSFGKRIEGSIRGLESDTTRLERGAGRAGTAMDRLGAAISRNRVQVENHGASLKHWQAITLAVTALILGAGNDIAALGSALGAGLTVLGGAAAATVVGVGVGIAAVAGLARDLSDLPDEVRPAAKAFQDLKGVFKDLQTSLTVSAFRNSEATWRSLGDTIKGLTPALDTVAEAVGQVIDSFAKGIAPGTRAFGQLDQLIRGSAPIFTRLAGVVGKFASGLLGAFASPRLATSINKLLDWLDRIGSAFERFTLSKGFDKWLDNADSVFGAIGRLIDGLGKTLNNLSTDKAVQSLNGLIDAVTRFLPTAQGLIEIGGALDPLGLIAGALDAIGEAIDPLIGPLTDLAKSLHDIIAVAIDEWGKDLKGAFSGLAPLIQGIADAFGDVDSDDVRDIADAVLIAAAAFLVMKGAKGIAGLASKVGDLANNFDTLSTKSKALKGAAGGVGGALAGITTAFAGGGPGGSAASGAITGASVGGLPGLLIGALAGAIASMFTDWPKWQNGLNQIGDFFGTWWSNIQNGAFSNGWQQIVDAFGHGWEQIAGAFANGWNQIVGFFNGIYTGILVWVAQIIAAFVNWGVGIVTSVAVWIQGVVQQWDAFWTGLYVGAVTWITQIITNIILFGQGIVTNILSFVATVVAGWNSFWSGLWNSVVTWTAQIIANVLSFGRGIISNIQGALNGLTSWWNGFWNGLVSGVTSAWNTIISNVRGFANTVIGIINGVLSKISALTGGIINLKVPSIPKTATGGVFFGAQTRVIGEAGPEAVVPLNRPLSQVDPAVRALSAYAQGKGGTAPQATPSTVIAEGAIQVISRFADGRLVAAQVLDGLVARVAK